jgi:hypothetical protein
MTRSEPKDRRRQVISGLPFLFRQDDYSRADEFMCNKTGENGIESQINMVHHNSVPSSEKPDDLVKSQNSKAK